MKKDINLIIQESESLRDILLRTVARLEMFTHQLEAEVQILNEEEDQRREDVDDDPTDTT